MPDGKARPRPRTAPDRPERLGGACPGRRVLKTANLQGKSGDGGFDRCENIAENGITEPITPSSQRCCERPAYAVGCERDLRAERSLHRGVSLRAVKAVSC